MEITSKTLIIASTLSYLIIVIIYQIRNSFNRSMSIFFDTVYKDTLLGSLSEEAFWLTVEISKSIGEDREPPEDVTEMADKNKEEVTEKVNTYKNRKTDTFGPTRSGRIKLLFIYLFRSLLLSKLYIEDYIKVTFKDDKDRDIVMRDFKKFFELVQKSNLSGSDFYFFTRGAQAYMFNLLIEEYNSLFREDNVI